MVISHHTVGQWRPAAKAAGKLPHELTGSSRLPAPESLEEGGGGGWERWESTWPLPVLQCEGFQVEVPGTSPAVGNPASSATHNCRSLPCGKGGGVGQPMTGTGSLPLSVVWLGPKLGMSSLHDGNKVDRC